MYNHVKSTGSPSTWEMYRKIINEVVAELRTAHDAYCHHLFNSTNTSNRKRYWTYIKKLRCDHSDISTLRVNDRILTTTTDKANT